MGYKQIRVCDCCGKTIQEETAYKITKIIMESDRFTDAAGSRDNNYMKLEFCPVCSERLVDSLEKIGRE